MSSMPYEARRAIFGVMGERWQEFEEALSVPYEILELSVLPLFLASFLITLLSYGSRSTSYLRRRRRQPYHLHLGLPQQPPKTIH
jgi:hypothetical protein